MRPRPVVILYVEDNRILLQTVRDVLEFAGWYVKPCTDFAMALALIESPRHFDVILPDNELQGMTGLRLTELARGRPNRRKTPIILISIEDRAEEARRAGANAFLRKPNNLIDLIETIRRLLGAGGGA